MLDRFLGTDPYQSQERFLRNSITEDVDDLEKLVESIAGSDLEDGELRKVLASPLFFAKLRRL